MRELSDSRRLWWRVTGMFAWVTLAALVVFHGANAIFGAGYDRWSHMARAGAMFLLVVPAVVLATRLLDRMPLSGIGLSPLRQGVLQLLRGMACWLIPAAAGVAVCLASGWAQIALNGSVSEMLVTAAGLLLLVFVFEAFPEELVFRGYVLRNLAARLGQWPALWSQAVLFTLWGLVNGGENSLSRSVLFFAFAVVAGLLRTMTGSVWTSIGFHLAFQTAAQLFGSVGGLVTVSNSAVLTVFAFGMLPFATALTLCTRLRHKRALHQDPRLPAESVSRQVRGLPVKGINYDVGTAYHPRHLSRPTWNSDEARDDIRVIGEELHCNAVTVFGSRLDRLADAAHHAARRGLHVWLQPRLPENGPTQTLEFLRQVSVLSEEIRRSYPVPVTLTVGCELSIFMRGIVPGRTFGRRTRMLTFTWPFLLQLYNRKLNRFLGEAAAVAREHFRGEVSYAAGSWEGVDWRPFDLVGVNLYRDSSNQGRYCADLRLLQRHGKPVVITEFGCCAYDGADTKGASGDDIVDWRATPPRIKGSRTRNEQVQADYLGDLIETYATEGVRGAFVFEFSEPSYPHAPDRRHDLDLASYGIVKAGPGDRWERKAAFHRVAGLYQSL
ncbi:CPBP family glutamic-type intramembrane protease [Nonomuraea sp. SYSU D8015]|uniref:CPBP family glutamic-type intramembrane protease n=1 Tax=Nonomuraea sp. SYSU D8015 TaxID=2593644 RepID=UPI0016600E16|nr:CPBP family glutamic-type intramembrane protease [Nonomuraea sp. SYSU D8015]